MANIGCVWLITQVLEAPLLLWDQLIQPFKAMQQIQEAVRAGIMKDQQNFTLSELKANLTGTPISKWVVSLMFLFWV